MTARRTDGDEVVGNTWEGRTETGYSFFPPSARAPGCAATSYPIIRVRHLLNLATHSDGRTLQTAVHSPLTVFHRWHVCAATYYDRPLGCSILLANCMQREIVRFETAQRIMTDPRRGVDDDDVRVRVRPFLPHRIGCDIGKFRKYSGYWLRENSGEWHAAHIFSFLPPRDCLLASRVSTRSAASSLPPPPSSCV